MSASALGFLLGGALGIAATLVVVDDDPIVRLPAAVSAPAASEAAPVVVSADAAEHWARASTAQVTASADAAEHWAQSPAAARHLCTSSSASVDAVERCLAQP
ncbi:MAG: hypothetical protein ACRDZU_05475 [Acidimicrobiales bacterium]